MRTELVVAAMLGGLGTYLIRWLPILAGERLSPRLGHGRLHRFLLALGPSAIAALLVLSFRELVPAHLLGAPWLLLPPALGAAAVVAVQRLTRNPAFSTLAGAVTVAVLHALNFS